MRVAERKWTDAQKNAIEADSGTVLVSAAAGSGKTSVLVERIVRKLTRQTSPVSPEELLVVTFTNAAAAEMRGRIALRISEVIRESGAAGAKQASVLSRLSEMQVCTMDAFCMELVKENFHSLGIEADFRILDGGESGELKKKAAVSVLERRFSEESETFLPLASMFDSGKNDTRFIESVIKLSDFSMSEACPEKWLREVADGFFSPEAENSKWGRRIADEVYESLSFCESLYEAALRDIDEDEELSGKYYGLFFSELSYIRELMASYYELTWDERGKRLEHLILLIKSSRLPTLARGYSENPSKLSAQEKRNTVKAVLEKSLPGLSITEAEHSEDMAVLRSVADELSDTVIEYNNVLLSMKKDAAAFDFSDISHFALALLTDSSAPDGKTPLARELTAKLDEILIDEYQDTNRAQDELFRALSKNGENMFFVGDVKQSIYRFRLASPEIFIEKCEEFPYYDGNAVKSKIILGENFRSRKGILDGVNFVFSEIMSAQCGDITYNEDERLNFPSVLTPTDTTDVSLTVIEAHEDAPSEVEARYIADIISRGVSGQDKIPSDDGERNAVYSDYCILLRSPSGTAQEYIKELRRRKIPVSSDISDGFFETPEIKTMMAYLRAIDNPASDTELLSVMLSPIFSFTPDEAARLRTDYGTKISLYGAVLKSASDGNEKCIALIKSLDRYKKLSACVPVDDIIREIYSDSAYPQCVSVMPDGGSRVRNLRMLLEKAEKASESYTTLGSFIRYMLLLRENGNESGAASDAGGVRIMSMHRSKGLEFPFVFIAGTTKRFNRSDIYSNLVINHKSGFGLKRREPENIKNYDTLSSLALRAENNSDLLSEEIRILYVAMTRAKQKLYMPVALKNAVKHICEKEYLLSNSERISPYLIKHSSCAADWLIMAFLRHPDSSAISFGGRSEKHPEGKAEISYTDFVPYYFVGVGDEEKAVADEAVVEAIRKKAGFIYKYAPVASALSKHTASSVDDEHFDPVGFGKSVPAFMFSEKMSPADIGTYTHRFLQYCDFEACKSDPEAEKARLVRNGRLTDKQASGVDMDAIKSFVLSDIMKRCEKAECVYREKQFTMAKSVCDTDPGIPVQFRDEKTVVIGKIDLVFIENKRAVIVDYKTDNIKDVKVLAGRYRQQMELYAEALEKSLGVSVSECILYSLRLKESIFVPLG